MKQGLAKGRQLTQADGALRDNGLRVILEQVVQALAE